MSASAFPRPPADDGNQTAARSHSQASLAARPASRGPSTKGMDSARGQPRGLQGLLGERQDVPHGYAVHRLAGGHSLRSAYLLISALLRTQDAARCSVVVRDRIELSNLPLRPAHAPLRTAPVTGFARARLSAVSTGPQNTRCLCWLTLLGSTLGPATPHLRPNT